MAPLQKRALLSLIAGLVFAIALVVVFITRDITTFDDDLGFRLVVYVLWIAVPLAYLIIVNLTIRKPELTDERDRLILAKAPKTQYVAILFSLVAWVIVLTEVFWGTGEVPVVFLTIIMISTLIISTLAQSLGILIGYWRMDADG